MNIKRAMAAIGLGITVLAAGVASVEAGGWAAPKAVVEPSAFKGVHGLAVLDDRRLLAGTVVGNAIWEVDRATCAAKVYLGCPEGQADDFAIGP